MLSTGLLSFLFLGSYITIRLHPEISNLARDKSPIASFIIRVISSAQDHKAFTHPEIKDKLLSNTEGFIWLVEVPLPWNFIIDIEFLDLKTACPSGGEPCSIWPNGFKQKRANATTLESLGRMLTEGIHTDITINASNGSMRAPRAVLAYHNE